MDGKKKLVDTEQSKTVHLTYLQIKTLLIKH